MAGRSEVYAKISDEGKLFDRDAVFIYPDEGETFVKNNELYVPSVNRLLKPLWPKSIRAARQHHK